MRTIDNKSSLVERLNIVYDYLTEKRVIRNQQHFAEQLGYQRAFISQALNNKAKVPLAMMLAIYSRYDMFSLEWLITGNGEQFEINKDSQITYGTLSKDILSTKGDIANISQNLKVISEDIVAIKNKLGV